MRSRKHKRIAGVALGSAVLLATAFLLAWDTKLSLSVSTIPSEKIDSKLRLLLLSDLHSCDYGPGQRELLMEIEALAPDVLFLVGDILDDEMPHEKGKEFLRAVGARYPTYYVPGNHEHLSRELQELLVFIKDCGIRVPIGRCDFLQIAGQGLQVCGMDDPILLGTDAVLKQAESACAAADPALLTILLSHRPELIEQVLPFGPDLVLAGHAHGGQWRLPGAKNGLFAPHQGLFPQYSGGKYDFPDSNLIVSRGLSRESTRIPRLCNPPELVLIELTPEEN